MRTDRYTHTPNGLFKTKIGAFVSYSDYEKIARKCHAQRRELRSLHKKWATVRYAMKHPEEEKPRCVEYGLDHKGMPLAKAIEG